MSRSVALESLVVSLAGDQEATVTCAENNTDVEASQQLNEVLCRPLGQEDVAGINFNKPAIVQNLTQSPTHINSTCRCFGLVKDILRYVEDVSEHGLLGAGRIDTEPLSFTPPRSEDILKRVHKARFNLFALLSILRRNLEVSHVTGFQLNRLEIRKARHESFRARSLIMLMNDLANGNKVEYKGLPLDTVLVCLGLQNMRILRIKGKFTLILVNPGTSTLDSSNGKKETKAPPVFGVVRNRKVTSVQCLVAPRAVPGVAENATVRRPTVKSVSVHLGRLRIREDKNTVGSLRSLNASLDTPAIQGLEVSSSAAGTDRSLPNSHTKNATCRHRHYVLAARDLFIVAALSLTQGMDLAA